MSYHETLSALLEFTYLRLHPILPKKTYDGYVQLIVAANVQLKKAGYLNMVELKTNEKIVGFHNGHFYTNQRVVITVPDCRSARLQEIISLGAE